MLISQAEDRAASDALALMSRIFTSPDQVLCRMLLGPARGLAAELSTSLDPAGQEAARGLQAYLDGQPGPDELLDSLEPAFVRLFVNSPQGIPAPLYHSAYVGQGLLMGPPAREMAARLEAAGLAPEGDSAEPPDHLAVELEYLSFLLENGWRRNDQVLIALAADFVNGFMLVWIMQFSSRLAEETQCLLYPLAAELLVSLLKMVGAKG